MGERWEDVESYGGYSRIEFARSYFDSEMVEFAKVISEKVVMYITRIQANNRASTVPVSQAGKPNCGAHGSCSLL